VIFFCAPLKEDVVGFDLSHTGIVLLSYNSDGNTTEQGAHDR
jgi:hypothetical protein